MYLFMPHNKKMVIIQHSKTGQNIVKVEMCSLRAKSTTQPQLQHNLE